MEKKRSLAGTIVNVQAVIKTTGSKINKSLIKERLQKTTLQAVNNVFKVENWASADEQIPIFWQLAKTVVGEVLIASTRTGVCFLGFTDGDATFALADLKRRFPANELKQGETVWLTEAVAYLNKPERNLPVRLHLKGTDFQLTIWKKLMQIPFGGITTYKDLGTNARYARATGSAVGANPVSYILPCHRVVRADGNFDKYYWGSKIKTNLLAYEGKA